MIGKRRGKVIKMRGGESHNMNEKEMRQKSSHENFTGRDSPGCRICNAFCSWRTGQRDNGCMKGLGELKAVCW